MRAIFVRHGESTGNAGTPCNDLAKLELTEKGRVQARQIADEWTEAPALIVVSPYLRAQQTAQPTRDRFSAVPVQQWPIEEFTYLEPSRWNGTARSERLPHIEDYWNTADPIYCDGPGAESFVSLLGRAEIALGRLRSLPDQDGTVVLFSHGQFMQAVRMSVLYPGTSNQDKMRSFWLDSGLPAFQNAERFNLELLAKGWAIQPGGLRPNRRFFRHGNFPVYDAWNGEICTRPALIWLGFPSELSGFKPKNGKFERETDGNGLPGISGGSGVDPQPAHETEKIVR